MNSTLDAQTEQALPRHARDVMTTNVVSVEPETPVRDVAKRLLENHISAVPVVTADGVPIGTVSEGDLIGRAPEERLSRTDWWLRLTMGEQPLDDVFKARLEAKDRTAPEVMSAPLVTVSEDAALGQIACLMAIHHLKRVPVLRDGRIVGIVSRADLLHAVGVLQPLGVAKDTSQQHGMLRSLFGEYKRPAWEVALAEPSSAKPATPASDGGDPIAKQTEIPW